MTTEEKIKASLLLCLTKSNSLNRDYRATGEATVEFILFNRECMTSGGTSQCSTKHNKQKQRSICKGELSQVFSTTINDRKNNQEEPQN